MKPPPGAILAGGQSLRMGTNKAFLEIDGKLMIRHPLDVLQVVCSEVAVIGGSREGFSILGVRWHPDAVPDCGPLGGILTALKIYKKNVVVAACDLPRLRPDLLRLLISQHFQAKAQITVPQAGERIQPLVGIYHPSCLPILNRFLARGERRVLQFLQECNTLVVRVESILPSLSPDTFLNVNTPAEYESSRR